MLSVKNEARLSAEHKKSGAWGVEREEKLGKGNSGTQGKELSRVAESNSFLVVLASLCQSILVLQNHSLGVIGLSNIYFLII